MEYPFEVFSWKIISEDVALKKLDKSAFLHHGTGIPKEIITFFHLPQGGIQVSKPITLQYDRTKFACTITFTVHDRFRLFWKTDFSDLLHSRYPNLYANFQKNETESIQGSPSMKLRRIGEDTFKLEFTDAPGDWSDEELEACIGAYFEMLELEKNGKRYNKAAFRKKLLETTLNRRTQSSVEFRMENISFVLQSMGRAIIAGYKPARNVGKNIARRIKAVMLSKEFVESEDYKPTASAERLARSVQTILKNGVVGIPYGNAVPKQREVTSKAYDRDPKVVAWVWDNAKGACELCDQKAPFKNKEGRDYLEVHHVVALSNNGRDEISNAVALCPNCHKACHHSSEASDLEEKLMWKVNRLKP